MKLERLRIDNGRVEGGWLGSLNSIYLNLMAGESLGIVFANLYEKAALIRVLQAQTKLSYGMAYIDEQPVRDPDTIRENVHVLNRGAMLMPRLSIWENVFYGSLPETLFKTRIYQRRLADMFREFGLRIPPDKPVDQLSHVEAVQIELMKAFALKRHIIVLADLSYVLAPAEMATVMRLADALMARGFSVILIESAWNVIFQHSTSIAIIRDGRTQGVYQPEMMQSLPIERVLRMHAEPTAFPETIHRFFGNRKDDTPVLTFSHVSSGTLKDVHCTLARGQMLKIFYYDDRNCEDMLALLHGAASPSAGTIQCVVQKGRQVELASAKHTGICFVGDNAYNKSLLSGMCVLDNLGIALGRKARWLWLRRDYQASLRTDLRALLDEDIWDVPVSRLTPVQAQKLAYGRWIIRNPAALVCVNPFTGMDYQVDAITRRMLALALERDIAVLIVASYLPAQMSAGETLFLRDGCLYDGDGGIRVGKLPKN